MSPGLMVRQESRVSMKNGAMQSARGIWRSVKALRGVLRALLWPTEGVVEVGIHGSIWAERTQKPPVEAFKFQISEVGYRSLRSYLRATIASEEPVGIVGNSRFCVARSSYHLFHHCHHYTAKGLREAGLPISMSGALTRDGFAKQLRRIMPLS